MTAGGEVETRGGGLAAQHPDAETQEAKPATPQEAGKPRASPSFPSRWNSLSGGLHQSLTTSFSLLDPKDRLAAAQVCKAWSTIIAEPDCWRNEKYTIDLGKEAVREAHHRTYKAKGAYVGNLWVLIVDNLEEGPEGSIKAAAQRLQASFAPFPNLQHLSFEYQQARILQLDYGDLAGLPALRAMTNLVELKMNGQIGATAGWPDSLLLLLVRLPKLRFLSMYTSARPLWGALYGEETPGMLSIVGSGTGVFSRLPSLESFTTNLALATPMTFKFPSTLTQLYLCSFAWTTRTLGLLSARGLKSLVLSIVPGVPNQILDNMDAGDVELNIHAEEMQAMLSTVTELTWDTGVWVYGAMTLPQLQLLQTDVDYGLSEVLEWPPECQLKDLTLAWSLECRQALDIHNYSCLTTLTKLELSGETSEDVHLEMEKFLSSSVRASLKELILSQMLFFEPPPPCLAQATALTQLHYKHCIWEPTVECLKGLARLTQLQELVFLDDWEEVHNATMSLFQAFLSHATLRNCRDQGAAGH